MSGTTQLNRVAITGLGAICGLGNDLNSIWNGVTEGRSGISQIEREDFSKLPVQIAGSVKDFKIDDDLLSEKEAPRFDKFIQYSLQASKEALTHAGLNESLHYDPKKCGVILGVGMGGFPIIEEVHDIYKEKGHRRVSPFFIPAIIPNMAPGMVSIKFGLEGSNYSVSSACASSCHAMLNAFNEIRLGRQDMIVSGGSESVITHLPFTGFISMKALSKRNDEPTKASRPFDTGRDGFVMGEGAGILVLENLEKAKARGAKILGEIVGVGSSSDCHHITAPHPEGSGAIQCMSQALEEAGLDPNEVDYINAHGTSTPLGDIAETKAIKEVFKDHAYKLKVSSTKSMTGHLLGAAGGIESVFSTMAVSTDVIPPTINLEEQDPECDLDYVANKSINSTVNVALNNSFGFGGTNSSVIIKKYT